MPLHDIPPNISRHAPSSRHSSKARHHDEGLATGPRPPPHGIMGMLKNTTELGDVGIFAQRPPRVPRSNTQSSLGTVSNTGSQYSQRHRSTDPERLPTRSSHRPHPSAARSTRRHGPGALERPLGDAPYDRRSRPYPPQYRSSHHRIPRSLHTYRSLGALRDRGRVPTMSSRSYVRDDRGVRSGAVSPATSNVYEYERTRRPHWDKDGSIRTRASSPISMLTANQSLHDYRTEYGNPTRPIHRTQSPAIRFNNGPRLHARSTPRAGTPTLGMSAWHRFDSQASLASVARSTVSNVPQWYDYSESFAEEDEYSVIGLVDAAGSANKLALPIQAKCPQKSSPAEVLVELPASHSRKSSQLSFHSRHSRHLSNQSRRSHGSHDKVEEHELDSNQIAPRAVLDEKVCSMLLQSTVLTKHSSCLFQQSSFSCQHSRPD